MGADPTLLDLQAHDLRHDVLVRQRTSLPEAAALADATAARSAVESRIATLTESAAVEDRARNKLEGEIDLQARKAKSVQDKLFSGTVGSPRELSALQADAAQLERQQGDLEEQLLEVLMRLDELTPDLDAARAEADELTAAIAAHETALGAAIAAIDAELADIASARADVAATVDAGLLATYDKIRAQNAGSGAARLAATTCEGCHLGLSSAEIVEIKAEAVGCCPNCGVILIVDQ